MIFVTISTKALVINDLNKKFTILDKTIVAISHIIRKKVQYKKYVIKCLSSANCYKLDLTTGFQRTSVKSAH